ncbi:MAG: MerR family transcriptional regulator [Mycobacteriales bacterium]
MDRTPTSRPRKATKGLLQIGDVAEQTGLSLRTVRHYEDVGLLPPAERSPGGFRLYDEQTVQRLLVIKQMKPLEFTLEQMKELLNTLDHLNTTPTPAARRRLEVVLTSYASLVEERVRKVEERLDAARRLHDTLAHWSASGEPRRASAQ